MLCNLGKTNLSNDGEEVRTEEVRVVVNVISGNREGGSKDRINGTPNKKKGARKGWKRVAREGVVDMEGFLLSGDQNRKRKEGDGGSRSGGNEEIGFEGEGQEKDKLRKVSTGEGAILISVGDDIPHRVQ